MDFNYIKTKHDSILQLSHASNILNKYKNGKLTAKQQQAFDEIVPQYATYLKKMLAINKFDKNSINTKTDLLNDYYNFLHNKMYDNIFSAQGKFRSTILEEFLFLIFKDFVDSYHKQYDENNVLNSGSVKAYSNIYFKPKDFVHFIQNPEIGVNEKDQDYAIYRSFDISIDQQPPQQIRVPAIAVEVKTYIDKTMLDSIIATAEKIKNGNPHARFIAVTETYDVSLKVDPAYARIDQIYVLRKTQRKAGWSDIDKDVVWKLFEDTENHLKQPWSDIERKMKNSGVII